MNKEQKAQACLAARSALKHLDPDNQVNVNEDKLGDGVFEYFIHPYGWVASTTHELAVRKMAILMLEWRAARGLGTLPHLVRAAAPAPAPATP